MSAREKSALYPGVTWEDCMEFIGKIANFNTKAVSYQELASKYGLTSTTTKSFTARIGTAKQFGLITTRNGNTIELTEQSKKLLYPTGDSTRDIMLSCFSSPPLYAKLIEKYDCSALPSAEILANILMNEHRISRSAKDLAAKCFIESATQLGLISSGIFCFSESNDSVDSETSPANEASPEDSFVQEPAKSTVSTPSSFPTQSVEAADYITQSIPFESGKVAQFSIPIDATEDDLLLLHDMLDILLKRKFKIEI